MSVASRPPVDGGGAGEWEKNGVRLYFDRTGVGRPFVFGHGLGGSRAQVEALLGGLTNVERLTPECRGHGSSALGPPANLDLKSFAQDSLDLAERIGWPQSVWGGISMGAALALHAATLRPQMVSALILVRPAWATGGPPPHLAILAELGHLLTSEPAGRARETFLASPAYARILEVSPDNAASLLGQFEAADGQERGTLLARVSQQALGIARIALASLRVPALVVMTDEDAMHPASVAHDLAEALPGAHLVQVTSKSRSLDRHRIETTAAIQAFLDDLP